jgi:hypothetical protein
MKFIRLYIRSLTSKAGGFFSNFKNKYGNFLENVRILTLSSIDSNATIRYTGDYYDPKEVKT